MYCFISNYFSFQVLIRTSPFFKIHNFIVSLVSHKKTAQESIRLAECVGDVRALLRTILSDSLPSLRKKNQGKCFVVFNLTGDT